MQCSINLTGNEFHHHIIAVISSTHRNSHLYGSIRKSNQKLHDTSALYQLTAEANNRQRYSLSPYRILQNNWNCESENAFLWSTISARHWVSVNSETDDVRTKFAESTGWPPKTVTRHTP